MIAFRARLVALGLGAACSLGPSVGSAQRRPPLASGDIDAIIALERIEDRRDFDASMLRRASSSAHREVRRRAALAIARLYDPRGRELLRAMRADVDTAVLATVVWATGQLVDTGAVQWLDSLLQDSDTPVGVATEAAGAFGKIRTPDTQARLGRYLDRALVAPRTGPVVSEALLSLGRHRTPGEVRWFYRWSSAGHSEAIRWRTAWALTRSGLPDGIPILMRLARDASPQVRYWAMRGLRAPLVDSSLVKVAAAQQVLITGLSDSDRRVRVEALRRLATYPDTALVARLASLVAHADPWMATSAAEGLGRRGPSAMAAMPSLRQAISTARSSWTRAAALSAAAQIDRSGALSLATALSTDTAWAVRSAATNALTGLGRGAVAALERLATDADRSIRGTARQALFVIADSGLDLDARRRARIAAFASTDYIERVASAASMSAWADSTDVPMLLDAMATAVRDTSPWAADAIVDVLADIEARGGRAAEAFFARFPASPSDIIYGTAGRAFGPKTLAAWGTGRPIPATRTDADYRRIVETLVVPAYKGASPPRLAWETTRGVVETDLNPFDAPLATDYLLDLVARGAMKDIRFERVIPNFVAQQGVVLLEETLQRDEISRGRLVRGNLSWGSNIGNAGRFPGTRGPGAAYDTGPAVYTFGITPQPHNEGDFTALGQIIRGMDIVDRIELGDMVKSVRRIPR